MRLEKFIEFNEKHKSLAEKPPISISNMNYVVTAHFRAIMEEKTPQEIQTLKNFLTFKFNYGQKLGK